MKRALLPTVLLLSVVYSFAQTARIPTGTSERILINSLLSTTTKEQRTKLLEQHEQYITGAFFITLIEEGIRLSDKSEYERGEKLIDAGNQIAEALGEASIIVDARRYLGELYIKKGEPSKAIIILQSCASLPNYTHDKKQLLLVLRDFALAYRDKGEFQKAYSFAQQAFKLAEELKDNEGMAWGYLTLGSIYYLQTKFEEALKELEKCRELIAASVKDDSLRFEAATYIAAIYMLRGNYKVSYQLFQESLRIARQLDQPRNISRALKNVGILHYYQGDFDSSFRYLKQGLEIAEKSKEKRAISTTLHSLGFNANELGRHQEALGYLLRARQINIELGDQNNTLAIEEELASTYISLGQYDLAESYLRRILSTVGENVGFHRSVSLYYLGKSFLLKRDYDQAIKHLDEAAQIGVELQRVDLINPPLTMKGRALYLKKEYAQAQRILSQLIKEAELRRSILVGDEPQRALYFETNIEPYKLMVNVLLAQNEPFNALVHADQARGRVLLDVMRGGKSNIYTYMSEAERQSERGLKSNLISVNLQISKENARSMPSPAKLDALYGQQEKSRLAYESFRASLYAKYQVGARFQPISTPLTFEDLNKIIPDTKTAILEYSVTSDNTLLFVLTRNESGAIELNTYSLAINSDEMRERVEEFRWLLINRDQEHAKPSQKLFRSLVGPALQHLKGKSLICIIPDSTLWNLPFQALQSPSGRFLIEDHAVFYSPSLTVLRESSEASKMDDPSRNPNAGKLLALGNPLRKLERMSPSEDERLGPLPHTEEEVQTLVELLGKENVKSLIRQSATEKVVKAEIPHYKMLHFAVHTILENRSPMYSRILLSTSTEVESEDGQLEAWEITNIRLNASLVVLSSCLTALGKVGAGEGMMGIAWAFAIAGARTTVASQWKVDSEATAILMGNFYQELLTAQEAKGGQTKAESLRKAQLVVLRNKKYRDPFFWAPFVLIGDGASLNRN